MKWKFFKKEGNDRLILIFGGWSTDSDFYSGINFNGWDVLVVTNYSNPDFPIELLDGYSTIYLFAWSLGVYAAQILPPEKITIAIAVNGTEQPVNNMMGIPVSIYDGTLKNLNERNLLKFRKRMCGDKYDSVKNLFHEPHISTLKKELEFIKEDYFKRLEEKNFTKIPWTRVIIAENDLIFSPENQLNFWNNHFSNPEIVRLDAPHYIDLNSIIQGIIPSLDKIGSRFEKALLSYDEEATAQKLIVNRLKELCPEKKLNQVIEIGPGTGLLTKIIWEKTRPERIDLIDLYPLPDFPFLPDRRYVIEDAEKWILQLAESNPSSVDAVFSSSAIQWFVNTELFFKNIADVLKPGGFILFSTFISGNLKELYSINPNHIIYKKREEIENILSRNFKYFVLKEEDIVLKFDSARQLLLHLHKTGVGGSSTSTLSYNNLIKSLPTQITFKPLYIMAFK